MWIMKRPRYDFDLDDSSMDTSNFNQISSIHPPSTQLFLDKKFEIQQASSSFDFFHFDTSDAKENAFPLSLPFHHHHSQHNLHQPSISIANQKVNKWWTPKNEEQYKLFQKAKEDVFCLLSVCKEGIKAQEAFGIISKETETEIDFVKIGFCSFGQLLFHFDDILMVRTNGNDDFIFLKKGAEVKELSHITNLIQKTPSGRTNYVEFKATHLNTFQAPLENLLKIHYDLTIPSKSEENYRGCKRKSSVLGTVF